MPSCFHFSDEACCCRDEDLDDSAYCEVCGERDVTEALVPVYVSTNEWHRVERLCHPECRELFVAANLPAILESLRLVTL